MSDSKQQSPHGYDVRQEADGIDRRRLWQGTILTVVGIGASLAATLFFLRDTPTPAAAPPAPAVADTSLVLAAQPGLALHDEQRAALGTYGWVDRDAGVARIPVERAMDLLAADGGRP